MALEQLLTKQLNARDFQPVKESAVSARQRFANLKRTTYYQKTGMWGYMENLMGEYMPVHTEDQLLAILAEEKFDKGKAKKEYETLKSSPLHRQSRRKGEWGKSNHREYECTAGDQLLGVLVEGTLFDVTEARKKYEALKETDFYDSKRGKSQFRRLEYSS